MQFNSEIISEQGVYARHVYYKSELDVFSTILLALYMVYIALQGHLGDLRHICQQ